jgi:hypothetical protein
MIVIVDIDKTLSDARGRDALILGEGQGSWWDAYHEASAHDDPIKPMIEFINILSAGGATLVGLTARPEKWRPLTLRWLIKHDAMFEELLMRPNDDYSKSAECKLRMLSERFPNGQAGLIILDDDVEVIEAMRNAGYIALGVNIV